MKTCSLLLNMTKGTSVHILTMTFFFSPTVFSAGRKVSKNYSCDRRRKRSTLDDLEELIAPDRNVGGDGGNRQSTCDSFEESVTCSSSQVDSTSGSGVESADKELLLQELQNLRIELEHSRQTICKLQQKEHQLRDRYITFLFLI